MTLSPDKMQKIYAIQRQMHQKFRDIPAHGRIVEYLGRDFVVYPGVFWPHEDSKALVRNYVINPGEDVCDVCTGSGVIAIHSAWRGARRVVALDINPNAIKATRENACKYGVGDVVDERLSDVFSALRPREQFDVITMNSPFTNHREEQGDYAERTIWDQDLHVHKSFFEGLPRFLKPNGRAYVAQANFAAVKEMRDMASEAGFSVKQIGKNIVDDLRTFYAFELRRKVQNYQTNNVARGAR